MPVLRHETKIHYRIEEQGNIGTPYEHDVILVLGVGFPLKFQQSLDQAFDLYNIHGRSGDQEDDEARNKDPKEALVLSALGSKQ